MGLPIRASEGAVGSCPDKNPNVLNQSLITKIVQLHHIQRALAQSRDHVVIFIVRLGPEKTGLSGVTIQGWLTKSMYINAA